MKAERRPVLLLSGAALVLLGAALRLAVPMLSVLAYAVIFVGLVCAAFWLLRPRWARRALAVLLALGTLYFAAVETVIVSASRGSDGDADCLIVLGAGVDGTTPSASLLWRLEAALNWLEAHPEAVAVVSGGQGNYEDISEAECMYRWLTARGVAPERVLREDSSSNTLENIRFSMDIIGEGRSVAVVSAEYHLCRALYMARAQGVESPVGVPAKTGLFWLKLNYFVREAFALTAFWVLG